MKETKVTTAGFKELALAMRALPQKTSDSLLRSYNRKLAKKYIFLGLKSSMPYSGRQQQRIIMTSVKGDKTGVSAGYSTKAKWVLWQEYGTKERFTKVGASRGQIVGRERVSPYIERQIPAMINEWQNEVGNAIITDITKRTKSAQNKLNKLG